VQNDFIGVCELLAAAARGAPSSGASPEHELSNLALSKHIRRFMALRLIVRTSVTAHALSTLLHLAA